MYLTQINVKARNWVFDRWGRPFPHCREGANRFVHLAHGYGYTNGRIKKVGGFHGSSEHHWAVDSHTGWIYDPTQEQFHRGSFSPVIRKNHPSYNEYVEAPIEFMPWDPHGAEADTPFERFRKFQRWEQLTGSYENISRGAEIIEVRTAVNGRKYVHCGLIAHWSLKDLSNHLNVTKPQMRCCNIFTTKKGYRIDVITQRLVFSRDQIYTPTKRVVGWTWGPEGDFHIKEDGKWVPTGEYSYLRMDSQITKAIQALREEI